MFSFVIVLSFCHSNASFASIGILVVTSFSFGTTQPLRSIDWFVVVVVVGVSFLVCRNHIGRLVLVSSIIIVLVPKKSMFLPIVVEVSFIINKDKLVGGDIMGYNGGMGRGNSRGNVRVSFSWPAYAGRRERSNPSSSIAASLLLPKSQPFVVE
jgi:hypothetical protein